MGASLRGAVAWPLTSSASTSASVRDLVVTSTMRASLLHDGAASHGLPVKDYLGLRVGLTYLAIDFTTRTYYAGAALDPSPTSLPAQVSNQDDGSYLLFTRHMGAHHWKVYNDGLGAVRGTKCPVLLPAAVVKVWHWTAGTCYPPTPA